METIVDVINESKIFIDADVSIPFLVDFDQLTEPKKNALQLIMTEVRNIITDSMFRIQHKHFLNIYMHCGKTNNRFPSFFMMWHLFKKYNRTVYNFKSYESYFCYDTDIEMTNIKRDESIRSDWGYEADKSKMISQIFTHMTDTSKKITKTDRDILEKLNDLNVWSMRNVVDNHLRFFYNITYKDKTYYITYTLLYVYFCDYKKHLPKSLHIRASTSIIDPFLNICLMTEADLYNNMKNYLKIGHYHVGVSLSKPSSQEDGKYGHFMFENKMSLYHYIEPTTIFGFVKVPKFKIKYNPKKQTKKRVGVTPTTHKPIRYGVYGYLENSSGEKSPLTIHDSLGVTIIYCDGIISEKIPAEKTDIRRLVHPRDGLAKPPIRYFKQTIPTITICLIHKNNYTVKKIPTICNPIHADINFDVVEIEPDTLPTSLPQKIITDKYIHDLQHITTLLNNTYETNPKFKTFLTPYTAIKVIKTFHYDQSKTEKSLHFNVVFMTDMHASSVYHMYVSCNIIYSITTLINIL